MESARSIRNTGQNLKFQIQNPKFQINSKFQFSPPKASPEASAPREQDAPWAQKLQLYFGL